MYASTTNLGCGESNKPLFSLDFHGAKVVRVAGSKCAVYCYAKKKCMADIDNCEGGIIFGNEQSCKFHKMHFCSRSNQCIWNDWVCDGFVQCLRGDDEDFEMCLERESFPKGATLRCQEANRTGYKIEILAVPCNGIPECQDGIDVDLCEREGKTIVLFSVAVAAFIMFIWFAIYLTYDGEVTDSGCIGEETMIIKELKGEALAQFKVVPVHESIANFKSSAFSYIESN